MDRKRIVFVGGGSFGWMPRIVKDMLLTDAISDSEFVLYDINKEASDLVAAFLQKLNTRLGTHGTVISTDDKKIALEGADYVVITISTGGLDAMAHDIAIPEEYGILHTVGDTAGPGGWARLIRNYEVFVDLAGDINRYADGAVVLNYTNPMSTLTDVLSRLCNGPVVGLCHGLFENINKIVDIYGLEDEDELALKYAGLNHFFWVTEARTKSTDIFADLRQRVANEGLTALLAKATGAGKEKPEFRELATALFNETGAMPYFGDRHTCEFFPCYITSPNAMEKYKIVRTTIAERREGAAKLKQALVDMIEGDIPDEYTERSRETAADIVATHATGGTFIDVGNLPNIGQVSNLPRGVVVETAMRVDQNGFAPVAFGDLPDPVLGFVEPCARSYRMSVEACVERDKEKALQALRIDPVCAGLTGAQVREMGERLLDAHKGFANPFES